jgi:hypothetical protein
MNDVQYLLWNHCRCSHSFTVEKVSPGANFKISLGSHVSAYDQKDLLQTLSDMPAHSIVEIDGSRSRMIEHSIIDAIRSFMHIARHRDIRLILTDLPSYPV